MIHEILKESCVYQEAMQEVRQEAIQEGKQVGLQEGKVEDIFLFVELRFPTLLTLAKEILARETTLEQLQSIQKKLILANTLEEANAALQEHNVKH